MKKQNKIYWIIGLILVGVLLFRYSQQFIIIPSAEFISQASLISQDSQSATYSYSTNAQGTIPDMQCQDPHLEEVIDFVGASNPYSESSLPCLVEGLQLGVPFTAQDISISLPVVQNIAPCNGGANETYTAVYEDTGTTCSVGSGAFIDCRRAPVSCHFRGTVKAYNSNGEQVPAVFGWVTSLSANVQALMEGVVCLEGQERCDEMNYSICSNNDWISQGLVEGECGYTLVCSDGDEDCDGLNYLICSNNDWISQGEITGHCGVGDNQTEQPRVYYRLLNNSCTQISMLPSLKTSNDYNTLAICQSHITGGGGGTTPTCSDGIMNQDETGIDCGGVCEPCLVEHPKSNYLMIIAIIGVILGIYLWRRKKR